MTKRERLRVLLRWQNDEQMSMSSPVDSQFFRMLLEEDGNNMRELLDAEKYLVPQPNLYPRAQGDGAESNGPSRHQSYRVGAREEFFTPPYQRDIDFDYRSVDAGVAHSLVSFLCLLGCRAEIRAWTRSPPWLRQPLAARTHP